MCSRRDSDWFGPDVGELILLRVSVFKLTFAARLVADVLNEGTETDVAMLLLTAAALDVPAP